MLCVLQPMMRHARDIDLMRAVAAAGEADIGLARLAGAVDDAADDRERHRRGDVREPLLQHLDGLDDVEFLARAGRAGDDGDAAMAQAERLQDARSRPCISSTGSADSETRIVSPMPAHSSEPMPIDDLTVPVRRPPASVMPRCSG